MTPRENFKKVIHFKKPDKWPWLEFVINQVVINWFEQGLPFHELVNFSPGGELMDGAICLHEPAMVGFSYSKYFGFADLAGCYMPVDLGPIPRYKDKITEYVEGKYIEYFTSTGVLARKPDPKIYTWYTVPQHMDFPVKDRKSWAEYKERFKPYDSRRYPKNWHRNDYVHVFENYQDGPTSLFITGFYGFGAQVMGIPTFIKLFYKDPDLMHEMAEHWAYFTVEALRDAVETLKDRIDIVFWWEDMASGHGPNISPNIFDKVFLHRYKKVTGFLKANGIDRIMCDSDGNTYSILPNLMEGGITGHWPLEVSSGMDARVLQKKYGERLFLVGNLDKRALVKGGEFMKKEIDSKVPVLQQSGGYIPGIDHAPPADMSLSRFKEYTEYLQKYL